MENTTLSPEAQAVLDAYFTHADLLDREVSHEEMLAAALRAAAMRTLLTAKEHEGSTPNDYELGWNAAVAYLQNIATELEAL